MRVGRFILVSAAIVVFVAGSLAGQEASKQRGLLYTIQEKLNLPTIGGAPSVQRATPSTVGGSPMAPSVAPSRTTAPPTVASPPAVPPSLGRADMGQPAPSAATNNVGVARTVVTTPPQAGASTPGSDSQSAPVPFGPPSMEPPSAAMGQARLHQRLGAFQNSVFGDVPPGPPSAAAPSPAAPSPGTASTGPSLGAPLPPEQPPRNAANASGLPMIDALPMPAPSPHMATSPTLPSGSPTVGGSPSVPSVPQTIGLPGRVSSPATLSAGSADDMTPGQTVESQPSRPSGPVAAPWSRSAMAESGAVGSASAPLLAAPREDDGASLVSRPTQAPVHAPVGLPRTVAMGTQPAIPATANVATPSGAAGRNVLIARQSPALSVETVGPRSISVGVEATYQVNVTNAGSVAAEQIVVTIDLPPWADVMGADVSSGSTTSSATTRNTTEYVWKIAKIEAMASEHLALRLIPRERKAIDLHVRWDFSQVASQAMIEVQEPQLELVLNGPREVLWGESQVYRLHVKNTGNGDATNVKLALSSLQNPQAGKHEHVIPVVAAGSEKTVDVALVASQTGFLVIDVVANGDHGVRASLSERVNVLRAALGLQVDAPELRFVGNRANFTVRLKNTGTAPARSVELTAAIPSNAKYISNIGGGRPDATQGTVSWTIGEVPPGGEHSFSVTCELTAEGLGQFVASATAAGGLKTAAEGATRVDAIADLALDIVDPIGPIAVGDEAEYVVSVRNRGTKQAAGIQIVAYFSQGIEPVSVEGPQHRLGAGQVVFEPIPAIHPGDQARLVVRAKADSPGNHAFRVEVTSPMGARLSSEQTTYYYGTGRTAVAAGTTPVARSQNQLQPPREPAAGESAEALSPPVTAPVGRTTGSLPYYVPVNPR